MVTSTKKSMRVLCAGTEVVFAAMFFLTFFSRRGVEVSRIANAGRRFIRNEEGAALAEYGILVAFIAIVAITAVTFFGGKISSKFSELATTF